MMMLLYLLTTMLVFAQVTKTEEQMITVTVDRKNYKGMTDQFVYTIDTFSNPTNTSQFCLQQKGACTNRECTSCQCSRKSHFVSYRHGCLETNPTVKALNAGGCFLSTDLPSSKATFVAVNSQQLRYREVAYFNTVTPTTEATESKQCTIRGVETFSIINGSVQPWHEMREIFTIRQSGIYSKALYIQCFKGGCELSSLVGHIVKVSFRCKNEGNCLFFKLDGQVKEQGSKALLFAHKQISENESDKPKMSKGGIIAIVIVSILLFGVSIAITLHLRRRYKIKKQSDCAYKIHTHSRSFKESEMNDKGNLNIYVSSQSLKKGTEIHATNKPSSTKEQLENPLYGDGLTKPTVKPSDNGTKALDDSKNRLSPVNASKVPDSRRSIEKNERNISNVESGTKQCPSNTEFSSNNHVDDSLYSVAKLPFYSPLKQQDVYQKESLSQRKDESTTNFKESQNCSNGETINPLYGSVYEQENNSNEKVAGSSDKVASSSSLYHVERTEKEKRDIMVENKTLPITSRKASRDNPLIGKKPTIKNPISVNDLLKEKENEIYGAKYSNENMKNRFTSSNIIVRESSVNFSGKKPSTKTQTANTKEQVNELYGSNTHYSSPGDFKDENRETIVNKSLENTTTNKIDSRDESANESIYSHIPDNIYASLQ